MLSFIYANYHKGDTIEIGCSAGIITGNIELVTPKYIVLLLPNGKCVGIAAADVHTFNAPQRNWVVPATDADTTDIPTQRADTDLAYDDTHEGNTPTPQETAEAEDTLPCKVVGKLSASELQRIDPKLRHRQYFRRLREDGQTDESTDTVNADTAGDPERPSRYEDDSLAEHAEAISAQRLNDDTQYIPADGQITFYSHDRRYGFIHDNSRDLDVYFHYSQIIDQRLYPYLTKGIKVCYNIERNSHGFSAQNVHFPCHLSDLAEMGRHLISLRYFRQAEVLVRKLYDIDPQAPEIQELAKHLRPGVIGGNEENSPYYEAFTEYMTGKKCFLDKKYDEAEAAYLKAIELNQRPESCVKDLLTLYVSLFKQTDDPQEKETRRRKALDFLAAHHHLLPDNLTNKQFVARNVYQALQDFEAYIAALDEILADPQVKHSSRYPYYLAQKAAEYLKYGHKDEAAAIIDEGLLVAPANRQFLRLKSQLNQDNMQPDAAATRPDADSNGEAAPGSQPTVDGPASPSQAAHVTEEGNDITSF